MKRRIGTVDLDTDQVFVGIKQDGDPRGEYVHDEVERHGVLQDVRLVEDNGLDANAKIHGFVDTLREWEQCEKVSSFRGW